MLGCAVVSAVAAVRLHDTYVAAQATERTTQAAVSAAVTDAESLSAKISGSYGAQPLADELTRVVAHMRMRSIDHTVDVTSIGTERGVAVDEQAMTLISEPVPHIAGLSRVRVTVKGGYKNYMGLKDWLTELVDMPVAISGLKIRDTAFELQLDVMGTM